MSATTCPSAAHPAGGAVSLLSRPRGCARTPEAHLTGYAGVLQADAYAGYNRVYAVTRKPGPVTKALCWTHARRKFFELVDIAANKRCSKASTPIRSEDHTSELQSLMRISYAVFCLNTKKTHTTHESRIIHHLLTI